ncbi:hypothetical protein MAR_014101 [Mya arenaria]|uniref:Uncharacterized protein n=1 Tax=Mya arenaria TaxID=6604 RepID=A0ABY7G3B7_MYAAR|nr:hypothetical protein MAR_014101 [Mya arenaria]
MLLVPALVTARFAARDIQDQTVPLIRSFYVDTALCYGSTSCLNSTSVQGLTDVAAKLATNFQSVKIRTSALPTMEDVLTRVLTSQGHISAAVEKATHLLRTDVDAMISTNVLWEHLSADKIVPTLLAHIRVPVGPGISWLLMGRHVTMNAGLLHHPVTNSVLTLPDLTTEIVEPDITSTLVHKLAKTLTNVQKGRLSALRHVQTHPAVIRAPVRMDICLERIHSIV